MNLCKNNFRFGTLKAQFVQLTGAVLLNVLKYYRKSTRYISGISFYRNDIAVEIFDHFQNRLIYVISFNIFSIRFRYRQCLKSFVILVVKLVNKKTVNVFRNRLVIDSILSIARLDKIKLHFWNFSYKEW